MNTKQLFASALFAMLSLASFAQHKSDLLKPFGWSECTSLTQTGYTTTGGGAYNLDIKDETPGKSTIVLKSNGEDMAKEIANAIKENDIIILDGSNGDFIIHETMHMRNLQNKTIIGRNKARLCTKTVFTPDIHKLMNDNKVLERSTSGTGEYFTLPNGARVKEECEYTIRKLLIEYLNDPQESFRHAGILQVIGCENIIIRNISFNGPGAIDIGGDDLLTVTHGTKHVWVDHCEFVDGSDGNFDISGFADFITVSWCTFRYTDRTYVHANTNLVGSNDNAAMNGEDNLNVTYAFCHWAEGCNQRMPMVRFGTIHLLNCLYTCANNSAAVNPRHNSEVLIEGCYFGKGVRNIFKQKEAKAYQFVCNIYTEKFKQPDDLNVVNIPYKYKSLSPGSVPSAVARYALPL